MMTKTQSTTQSTQKKPANKTSKKADPFVFLKSSIMIASIAGTMGGWLFLLNEETDSPSVSTTTLNTAVPANDELVVASIPIVDITQLRKVNEAAPVEAITVVARTRSSR
ncbi:hypothetical protein [Psychrobacter piscatorii]|uniref:hypothetical protein n=1 Tax=Psychrobacter piscatorii TaxID=554343 RepID=UPI003736A001